MGRESSMPSVFDSWGHERLILYIILTRWILMEWTVRSYGDTISLPELYNISQLNDLRTILYT